MQTKVCPECAQMLPVDKFNKSNRRDGYQTYCRDCHNAMQRAKYEADPMAKIKRQIRASRRKEKDPVATRRKELSRLYGLTLEKYAEIYKAQGGKCAICHQDCKTKKSLSVDHDHETGKVRGLLCNMCNRALGMFLDSPEVLASARAYLLTYKDAE